MGDKALRVVDGAIYVAKSAPLGTAVKVIHSHSKSRPLQKCQQKVHLTTYTCQKLPIARAAT